MSGHLDDDFEQPLPRRTSPLRAILILAIVALLALIGLALARRWLGLGWPGGQAEVEQARLVELLAAGDDRLASGDVEGARVQFLKASGLRETDPRVRAALARVEIAQAELSCLHLLLLPGADPQRPKLAQELRRYVAKAQQATDAALASAPEGQLDASLRAWAGRLSPLLVLAWLELGERADAEKEIERLAARAPGHVLLAPLRTAVEAQARAGAGPADAGADAAPVRPRRAGSGSDDEAFEFEHEPPAPHRAPGELEIPARPRPAPGQPDTTDLP
ncbi:MAG: hypothetical protein HY744_21250 [Deltaproteobacteria bacterium]|nr:hypothetical protein [Deltaproteobacteria bacterium]